MSPDKQYCVEECPPPTVPNTEKQCVPCSVKEPDAPIYTPEGCTSTCPDTSPFYHSPDMVCMKRCPTAAPYHLGAGECLPGCPANSFRLPGSFRCEASGASSPAPGRVSFAGASFRYALRPAPSYASLDLRFRSGAAFLQTGAALAGLRLRVAAEGGCLPAVFFLAERVAGSELQLGAERPGDSALLGAVLLRDAVLSGCIIVGAFREGGVLPVALRTRGHGALLLRGVLDLG